MAKLFIDTETCGLHGLPVLIQYAYDEGPITLYEIWKNPIWQTLNLIEEFVQHDWVMFNAAFDTFQLVKLYTTFSLVDDKDSIPTNIIPELEDCEESARRSNIVLKPQGICDLMLLARKGKYQSLMKRSPIKIKRIPIQISYALSKELERRVQIDDIFFSRAKDKFGPRWKIKNVKKANGDVEKNFVNIELDFKASGSLKSLARHAFNIPEPILFRSIEVDRQYWPAELGFAPYAKATRQALADRERGHDLFSPKNYNSGKAWPDVIVDHIIHWQTHEKAREYAASDIDYTRRLYYEHFNSPAFNDNDSVLAVMVANCRWKGYAVDREKIIQLRANAKAKIGKTPTAPGVVKRYIHAVMDEIDIIGLNGSTKRKILEEIAAEWKRDDGSPHPAALRAKEVLDARQAIKEIEIYDKLLLANRFHASFVVVGTLSSRMSGSDGLNAQGIKHDKYVREAFPLCDLDNNHYHLSGGDFKAFEVSIAAAVFEDERLTKDIQSGKKIHAIMGQSLYPHYSYEEIVASDGRGSFYPEGDMYDTGKKAVFSFFYGAEAPTWKNKLNIPLEVGEPAIIRLGQMYPGIKRSQEKIKNDFGALRQPGGIGSKVEWVNPHGFVESFLGFKRYFALENQIARTLFELGEKPPPAWLAIKTKVSRRVDRIQTVGGATRSALFGSAFAITSSTIRAATNHLIQSPGAEITKAVQRSIWDLQPVGINHFIVQPMNIHDEIMCPTAQGYQEKVREKVNAAIEKFKNRVPLLAIDWIDNIPNWGNKKG